MALTNYRRGTDKERRIMNKFKKRGCLALRSAGSHSIVDVVVVDYVHKEIKLIQAKLGALENKEKERILTEGSVLNGVYNVKFELWAS